MGVSGQPYTPTRRRSVTKSAVAERCVGMNKRENASTSYMRHQERKAVSRHVRRVHDHKEIEAFLQEMEDCSDNRALSCKDCVHFLYCNFVTLG